MSPTTSADSGATAALDTCIGSDPEASAVPGRHKGSSTPKLSKLGSYLKKPLTWFILLNVPFLFIFYDVWNLNTIVYAGSYLVIGLNPYDYGNAIPGGLLLQFYGLIVFQIFQASRSNFLVTAAALKVVYLVLTYCSGIVISRIAQREGVKNHQKLFLAFIFNPFVLFVNNVWVETDIVIIFLYLLGFWALHYHWGERGDYRYLIFGVLCIALGTFSYYSIALLVPTLILYSGTLRRQLQALAAFAIAGILFTLPLVIYDLSSLGGLAAAVQSPGSGVSPFSVFSLWQHLSTEAIGAIERTVIILIVALSILVPFVLRRLGASEQVSLFVAYAPAFLLFVNNVPGDNFVLLVGVLFLAVMSLKRHAITYKRIFALQMFILPQFLIAQLFDGVGGPVGVFYWSFYQFHASVDLYSILGGMRLWEALLGIYIACLLATIAYFIDCVLIDRRKGTEHSQSNRQRIDSPGPINSLGSRKSLTFFLVAIVLLAGVAPVGIAYDSSLARPTISVSGFDPGLFLPLAYDSPCNSPPECAYQLSSPTTFQAEDGDSSVTFANESNPIGLYRNLTNQEFSIDVRARAPWGTGYPNPVTMDVLNTSAFYGGLANEVVVNNTTRLAPSNASRFTSTTNSTNDVPSGANQTYELNGTGVLAYTIDPQALPGVQGTVRRAPFDLTWRAK